MGKSHLVGGVPHVNIFLSAPPRNSYSHSDIIACLVIGALLLVLFLVWQRYLERVQNDPNAPYSALTPPPLMKLSLWGRGNGKFTVIMLVALFTWCAFLGWNFWVQVLTYSLPPSSFAADNLSSSITRIIKVIARCRQCCVFFRCLSSG